MLTTTVEQFKMAIISLTATPRSPPNAMDTEIKELTEHNHSTPTPPDFSAIIIDMKNELATLASETRALLQHINHPFKLSPRPT